METMTNAQNPRPSTLPGAVDTLVIGGGQAGLAVGNALKGRGIDFVILDASQRVGDAWRNRWDSLRLFTPARMNGLPGLPFPGLGNRFIGKDEVAEYLENYAATMELPVSLGVRVERLTRNSEGFQATTSAGTITAQNVVVAMADYQKPRVPDFAKEMDDSIVQLHSSEYRNPSQPNEGPVLVVGLGNSGADIAFELAASHQTIVSGRESGAIPFRLESWFGRHIGTRLVSFALISVLNTSTPLGRKARPTLLHRSGPLVRVRPKELAARGVTRVGRITGVKNGLPVTADGAELDVRNVVWCTGYSPGFEWIDLPVFDESRRPRHHRGVSQDIPGLYFVGLYFLHAVWSETLPGVQPDVRYAVRHLASRTDPA